MNWMQLLVTGLPFVLSAITIWMTLLAGNLHPRAWLVGLVAQAGWLVWIVLQWEVAQGFLIMNIVMWVVYGRNHWKWTRRTRAATHSAWIDSQMAKKVRDAAEAFESGPAGQIKPLPASTGETIRFRRYNPSGAQQ